MLDTRYIERSLDRPLTQEEIALFGAHPLKAGDHDDVLGQRAPESGLLVSSGYQLHTGSIEIYRYSAPFDYFVRQMTSMETRFWRFNRSGHYKLQVMNSNDIGRGSKNYDASVQSRDSDAYKKHGWIVREAVSLPILQKEGPSQSLVSFRGPDVVIDLDTVFRIKDNENMYYYSSLSYFSKGEIEAAARCVGAIVGLLMQFGERGAEIAEDAARRLLAVGS